MTLIIKSLLLVPCTGCVARHVMSSRASIPRSGLGNLTSINFIWNV